ncbi:restriction endonuclease subunit S [Rhodobacter capsulatus]|uniref:Type I restriction-modification system RcaSBIIIP, S subunit n=1 Tax=Rhodobacter capsulatus (strain ATCC BAA-309 / NBRC 16581 / SB1003) TaxID=272942 RepID=D5ASI5_RHOCB|nr:restriction endonuclease subunit S [Rhodobacter capsulatus]ADE85076.1 type I restriction-modification system RcaSBIIIP, S subunit [Rhodobacter capsulatus SB 1003]ETD02093.1 type I restriction endonuclease EcoAI subunit S [Rhodobacter capsulatus DE442]ETD77767.1 type I restriction endonuclease EcoAI subunit S [Rhodobacter capsulatus R121]ETE54125.1 type I restriction endonuclease EcoAI subunit S [Rhodobacter capsulatus Y262]MDS0926728.1 restriction endonuclease subunit S [Rhodobacter capsula
MNADQLLRLYDRVCEAEDAVPRLRRFVLDLAVRGKLVPQDPDDEPASELLKRIEKEKARLVNTGEIRKPKSQTPLNGDVCPFLVPRGWALTRLGSVIDLLSGQHLQPNEYSSNPAAGIPYITGPSDFAEVGLSISRYALVRKAVARGGQLLLTVKGSGVGKTTICDLPEVAISRQLMSLAPILWSIRFLEIITHRLADTLQEQARSLIPGISREDVADFAFPLPPLAEQHRIVAKVEELMALLDRIEAARAGREEGRNRLTAATLARLTDPKADAPAAARFALDTLAPLTTRPDQIKTLRQTILNLAVRGKLVPQDPADEPASELLKRFKAAKIAHKWETGDARNKLAPDAEVSSYPLELPKGWAVQSFENLFLFIDYRGNTPPKTDSGVPLITAKNVRMGSLNREPREFISEKTFKSWMTRGFPKLGDLFFTTEAPLANVCLNDIQEPFALAQRVICLQPYAEISTHYLMLALCGDVMQSLIDGQATGMTAKGIKASKLKPLPISLPPLAEQHRIVAKVDALMRLLDALEAALSASATTRARLLDATLRAALTDTGEAA